MFVDKSGLVIEDDLDTELLVGRGMDDIMVQQRAAEVTPPDIAPPKRPKSHRNRNNRRSYRQASQVQ